jgi:hypothetical protein
MAADDAGRRLCRTPEEAFEAGREVGRKAPPLSDEQIDYLVRLWRTYPRPDGAVQRRGLATTVEADPKAGGE